LPADTLKIDRSFVHEIGAKGSQPALLTSILRMASQLRVSTVAGGIETMEQAKVLAAMGCQEVKGFLFSKPMPADEATTWLQEHGTPNYING
jgi:EAL domain-containing protein (putative c-di-GMP-specific phosphodiesterase class I)